MICLKENTTTGALELMAPQPTDLTTCSMVLSSGADAVNVPWNLSVSDALSISSAIVAVWGTAWAFKALILTLKGSNQHENDD